MNKFRIAFFIAKRIRQSSKQAFTTLVQKMGTVSIAVGLATLLIAFLVIKGFQQDVEKKLTSFQGQLQVFKYSLNQSIEEPPIATASVQGLPVAFPDYIQDMQAFAHKTVLIQGPETVEGMVLKGVDIAHAPSTFNPYMVAGQLLVSGQSSYSHEIVLSKKAAAKLRVQIGDQVVICFLKEKPRYRKLQVVGLYATHIEAIDAQVALCDIRLLQQLNNWPEGYVGGYDVFLKGHLSPSAIQPISDQLLEWLGYDLDVKSTQQAYPAIFDWLAMMKRDTLIFLCLILLVANSNIICIVLIQMMERTRMIGILKTLGATDSMILRIFLWNNLQLIGKGMLWGNGMGLGVAVLQTYGQFLRLDPTYYYTTYVPIAWDFATILWLNVLLFILVSFVLLVAVAIIARVRPIRAMRFR
jgi:lipoprotein-releasing system permease protein